MKLINQLTMLALVSLPFGAGLHVLGVDPNKAYFAALLFAGAAAWFKAAVEE